jgi:hypothetical protein
MLEPGTVVDSDAALGEVEGGKVGGRLVERHPGGRLDESAAAPDFPPRSSVESASVPSPHTPSTSATAPAPKASVRRRW